jgi:hypothetical protein
MTCIKLALTSLTCGGRSVGIVRLRTKGHGVFSFSLSSELCGVRLACQSAFILHYFFHQLSLSITVNFNTTLFKF